MTWVVEVVEVVEVDMMDMVQVEAFCSMRSPVLQPLPYSCSSPSRDTDEKAKEGGGGGDELEGRGQRIRQSCSNRYLKAAQLRLRGNVRRGAAAAAR